MKYILIAVMALGLVGCYSPTGDTTNDYTRTTTNNDNSTYEYFNNEGILQTCTTTESNGTTCSPFYDGRGELVGDADSDLSDEEISEITVASECPVGYAWCSIAQQCNPVSSTGSVCTQ